MTLRFDVVTLFPAILDAVTQHGISGRAVSRGLVCVNTWNLRDFAHDAYKTIDDRPYGGGPGMVMLPGPLAEAVTAIKADQVKTHQEPGIVVLLSPSGQVISQQLVDRVAGRSPLGAETGRCYTLVCGRYEGVDQRFIDQFVDELWSLGDFVLSGGEIAAMALIDAAIRRLPGALGDAESSEQESFVNGMLDWPHFTRPEVFNGQKVPDVLLSGHHERITDWRRKAALEATERLRPDLLNKPNS